MTAYVSPNASDIDALMVPYQEGMIDSPLEPRVVEALRSVFDPEIPVSIFDLGLIYAIQISEEGRVDIVMTLTAPSCPVAEEIPKWVKEAVGHIEGVEQVEIELVWDPFWRPDYMTESARLMLNLM